MSGSAPSAVHVIVGIDPGSWRLGLGAIEVMGSDMRALAWEVVQAPRRRREVRLLHLYERVRAWLDRFGAATVAVEETFAGTNPRSALALGEARGAVLVAAAAADRMVSGYPPATIKRTVAGHGRAGKEEVRQLVRMQLGLDSAPPPDAADALAVAMTHALTAWHERLLVETMEER